MKNLQKLALAAALLSVGVAAADTENTPPAKPNSVHAPLLRKRRPTVEKPTRPAPEPAVEKPARPAPEPAVEKPVRPAPEPAARPAPAAGERRSITRSYNYPVLTVMTIRDPKTKKKKKYLGELSYQPLTFTREKVDKPLRIMISDDTPGGSGETIRNSVWQAAITAAMLRNDTMHGVTISVGFSGDVDGPSAGAVTCLTILSAMDGRELPTDFAMTGTILPDGSIGRVGGVYAKMRAAAKAGAKRIFIPASRRMEMALDGKVIDLKRLAEELNVKLYQVENIEEAYAILHHKPYRRSAYMDAEVREMTRLPREAEDLLRSVIADLLKEVAKKAEENNEFATTTIFGDYTLSTQRARVLFDEGKYLPAALQIFRTWQSWRAVEDALPVLRNFFRNYPDLDKIKYLKEYHLRKRLVAFGSMLGEHDSALGKEKQRKKREFLKKHHYKNIDAILGFFPFVKGQTEITAQLEPVDQESVLISRVGVLLNDLPGEEVIDRANYKKLQAYWESELNLLLLIHLIHLDDNAQDEFLGRLGATMPKLRANRHAAEVERLFYVAASSTLAVAQGHINSRGESAAKRGEDFNGKLQGDPLYRKTRVVLNQAAKYHLYLDPRYRNKLYNMPYHLQASLKAQVSAFVLSSAVMVKYGPDSNASDFMPHLIRNARIAAIRNIDECIKAGIPCLQPICDFEIAEASRDSDPDPFVALTAYWRAALYSKALLMSFKPETDNL